MFGFWVVAEVERFGEWSNVLCGRRDAVVMIGSRLLQEDEAKQLPQLESGIQKRESERGRGTERRAVRLTGLRLWVGRR